MSTEVEAAIERMKADYQAGLSSPGTLYGEFHLSDVQRVLAAVDAAANATDPDVQRRFVRVLDMMEKHRIELVAARQSAPVTTEEVAEPKITVHYYEHSCEWLTKYCDEYHRRTAVVPASVLARYTRKPTEMEEER